MGQDASEALKSLVDIGFTPEGLDQEYDVLRLLGMVMAQVALLDVITDPKAKSADRVAAARILSDAKESPEAIVQRLRESSFARLNTAELTRMIQEVREGKETVKGLITKLK